MPQKRMVKCVRCESVFESTSCRAICPNCRYHHSCGEAEVILKTREGTRVIQIPGGGFRKI